MSSVNSIVSESRSEELVINDEVGLVTIDVGKVDALSIEVTTESLHALEVATQANSEGKHH